MNKKKLIISTMVTTMVSASMVPIIAIDNIVFEKNEKVLSQTRDEQSIDIGKKILDYINVKYEKKNFIMYRMLGTSGWLKDRQYNKIVYNNNSYISFLKFVIFIFVIFNHPYIYIIAYVLTYVNILYIYFGIFTKYYSKSSIFAHFVVQYMC